MKVLSNGIKLAGILGLLLVPLLLGCQSSHPIDEAGQTADPYKGGEYSAVAERWTREARIYRGFDVELIAQATFKAVPFRKAYAEEYARVYLLTDTARTRLEDDQKAAAERYHDFILAAFVPEIKWNDFDKKDSVWKVYLTTDGQTLLEPLEIRRIRKVDAAISHFYPFVTPWKVVYRLRFPGTYSGTAVPVIDTDEKSVSLVFTGVRGKATMQWDLDDQAP